MKHGKLTDLMALILFGIFAGCILLVLLTGADVYRDLVDRGEAYFQQRTAAQYITTRVRQGDTEPKIRVSEFAGVECLELREAIGGKVYLTRIYCYGGYLRELFTAENGEFSPEAGEKILEVRNLRLSLEESLLTAELTMPDGGVQRLLLYLRSKGDGI